MVLTSWESVRSKEDSKAPEFNSLSYHGKIKGQDGLPANITREDGTSGEEWSVKIFSTQRVDDRWLRRAFGKVGWVHRKEVSMLMQITIRLESEIETDCCVVISGMLTQSFHPQTCSRPSNWRRACTT